MFQGQLYTVKLRYSFRFEPCKDLYFSCLRWVKNSNTTYKDKDKSVDQVQGSNPRNMESQEMFFLTLL